MFQRERRMWASLASCWMEILTDLPHVAWVEVGGGCLSKYHPTPTTHLGIYPIRMSKGEIAWVTNLPMWLSVCCSHLKSLPFPGPLGLGPGFFAGTCGGREGSPQELPVCPWYLLDHPEHAFPIWRGSLPMEWWQNQFYFFELLLGFVTIEKKEGEEAHLPWADIGPACDAECYRQFCVSLVYGIYFQFRASVFKIEEE